MVLLFFTFLNHLFPRGLGYGVSSFLPCACPHNNLLRWVKVKERVTGPEWPKKLHGWEGAWTWIFNSKFNTRTSEPWWPPRVVPPPSPAGAGLGTRATSLHVVTTWQRVLIPLAEAGIGLCLKLVFRNLPLHNMWRGSLCGSGNLWVMN